MTTEQVNPNVLINFVLDRSGSMIGMTQATIDGFNSFIDEQRKVDGQALLSLTLFNTGFDVRYVARDLQEVPPMSMGGENAYNPGGGTALFDAVATTIKGTEKWLENHTDWKGRVVCVVLTDGQENSSHEWHVSIPAVEDDKFDVAQLIAYKQAEGWEFLFLGSGGSTWLEKTFGHVAAGSSFVGYAHTVSDNAVAYAGVSQTLTRSRVTGSSFDNSSMVNGDQAADVLSGEASSSK